MLIFRFSYAREWHEKLRELKESRAGLTMTVKSGPRSPGGGGPREALPTSLAGALLAQSQKPEITIKPAFKLDIAMKYGYQDNYYYRGSSDGSRFIGWRGINSTTDSLEILEEILSIKTNQTFLTAQLA